MHVQLFCQLEQTKYVGKLAFILTLSLYSDPFTYCLTLQ